MSKEKEEVTKEPSKFDKLKEMWKDKRGRAKIKLCLYLIFFAGVIIFARVLSYQNSKAFRKECEEWKWIVCTESNTDNSTWEDSYQQRWIG